MRKTILIIGVLMMVVSLGCVGEVSPENIYHHESEYQGPDGARNIQVETTRDGTWNITALSDDSHVPATFPMGQPQRVRGFPDALGSQNIKIAINEEVGHTYIAGLTFTEEATINIWEDGTVEVDREGVEATDKNGTTWISKKVRVGEEDAIIMIVR
jgi:hypothetical protein